MMQSQSQDLDRAQTARTLSSAHCSSLNQTLQIMTAIDVQGTSVSDRALALWAENSAISLKLFRTLKQRHQSRPHVAKDSRFPLSPWSTNMTTSKIICALDIRWNNRHRSHYFLVVPDLPHDIYIGADIMVLLNACIGTVNDIIWAPLSHQLTTSVNLKNLQSGQTMPDACAIKSSQVKFYCQFFHMYSTYIQRIEIALLSDPWCIQLTLSVRVQCCVG